MAAKVPVALRLSTEKLALVDAYAKARGSSRQMVLEAAVDDYLVDIQGGVPDLPVEESAPKPAAAPVPSLMSQRQVRLNREMGWDR